MFEKAEIRPVIMGTYYIMLGQGDRWSSTGVNIDPVIFTIYILEIAESIHDYMNILWTKLNH